MRLAAHIFFFALQALVFGSIGFFGVFLLVGGVACGHGRMEARGGLVGAILVLIAGVGLGAAWRDYGRFIKALNGDANAARQIQSQQRQNLKWIWRVNGPLLALMCLALTLGILFAEDAPLWMRILVPITTGAGCLLFVRQSIHTWRA